MTWPDTQVVLVGGVVGSRLVLAPFAFLARFKQILMVYFTSLDIYLAQTQGSRSFWSLWWCGTRPEPGSTGLCDGHWFLRFLHFISELFSSQCLSQFIVKTPHKWFEIVNTLKDMINWFYWHIAFSKLSSITDTNMASEYKTTPTIFLPTSGYVLRGKVRFLAASIYGSTAKCCTHGVRFDAFRKRPLSFKLGSIY